MVSTSHASFIVFRSSPVNFFSRELENRKRSVLSFFTLIPFPPAPFSLPPRPVPRMAGPGASSVAVWAICALLVLCLLFVAFVMRRRSRRGKKRRQKQQDAYSTLSRSDFEDMISGVFDDGDEDLSSEGFQMVSMDTIAASGRHKHRQETTPPGASARMPPRWRPTTMSKPAPFSIPTTFFHSTTLFSRPILMWLLAALQARCPALCRGAATISAAASRLVSTFRISPPTKVIPIK